MSSLMRAARSALLHLPRVGQHRAASDIVWNAAHSSSACCSQNDSSRSAGAAASSRYFSSDAQAAEEPRVAAGLNMVKGGADPPLMADGEYPEWLWQLAEPRPPLSQLRRVEADELTFEQQQRRLKLAHREYIRTRNSSKAKKQ